MPLYHFVTNDLPANTRASELDDQNTIAALRADAKWTGEDVSGGRGVTKEIVGRYIQYLCMTGFLKAPQGQGVPLPELELTKEQQEAQHQVGGRGATA